MSQIEKQTLNKTPVLDGLVSLLTSRKYGVDTVRHTRSFPVSELGPFETPTFLAGETAGYVSDYPEIVKRK